MGASAHRFLWFGQERSAPDLCRATLSPGNPGIGNCVLDRISCPRAILQENGTQGPICPAVWLR